MLPSALRASPEILPQQSPLAARLWSPVIFGPRPSGVGGAARGFLVGLAQELAASREKFRSALESLQQVETKLAVGTALEFIDWFDARAIALCQLTRHAQFTPCQTWLRWETTRPQVGRNITANFDRKLAAAYSDPRPCIPTRTAWVLRRQQPHPQRESGGAVRHRPWA